MPEIYYTNFSNEVTVANEVNSEATTIKAKSSRVDIPVLVGVNVLGDLLSAYAGPVDVSIFLKVTISEALFRKLMLKNLLWVSVRFSKRNKECYSLSKI